MSTIELSLEGKTALITGGSKGIGRAIALTYAEYGADVALAARGAEALSRTAKEIEERGVRALPVPTDVSDGAALETLVSRVCDELGGVDILVNNAATGELGGSLMGVGRDEFDLIMNVNVWAPLRLCQLCRPSMQKRGGGSVINIVSNEGIRPMPKLGIYSPSKAALINLTQMMAKEWAKDGIRAVSIAPGLVRTELAADLVKSVEESGVQINPLGVIGEPADIAAMALVAASPAGRFLTATTLVVDGGEISAGPFG
ncbi:MAG: SDR family oxidoreductase [Myxococcales bacterium]|nr:SDR family oxidoreductase [Myxococcales bacterium]